MKLNKKWQKWTTAILMTPLLSIAVGCANEGTSDGTPPDDDDWQSSEEDFFADDDWESSEEEPVALELPTEVLYRAPEGSNVFELSAFENELFWMESDEADSSPYRLMGASLGSVLQPSVLLDVAQEMFDSWGHYAASSQLVVMLGEDDVVATRLPFGEGKAIRTEHGSIWGSLGGDFVQDDRYVYFPDTLIGTDQLLRLDKSTLETDVVVDGIKGVSELFLAGDVLYFVSWFFDYDPDIEEFRNQIFQVDLNTGNLKAVTSDDLQISGRAVPLGDSLFYLGESDDYTPLMKVSLADGSVSHLADVDMNAFDLRTDGKRLFFADYRGGIYSLLPDGSDFSVISVAQTWYSYAISSGYLYVASGTEIRRFTLP